MSNFILGENPMNTNDNEVYIIHLANPVAIVKAKLGAVSSGKSGEQIYKKFIFQNSDGINENWTLSVHHFFTTDFIAEPETQALPFLDKAWEWYSSYLQWEDNNIDNERF